MTIEDVRSIPYMTPVSSARLKAHVECSREKRGQFPYMETPMFVSYEDCLGLSLEIGPREATIPQQIPWFHLSISLLFHVYCVLSLSLFSLLVNNPDNSLE